MSTYTKDPLFTAILSNDTEQTKRLKSQGAALSDEVRNVISASRSINAVNEDAFAKINCDYQSAVRQMSAEEFIKAIRALRGEIGEPLFFMPAIWQDIKKILFEDGVCECVLGCFEHKMNKARTMRDIIKRDRADILAVCAEHGWLSQPKKRDEMIEYATANGKTECTAFLLDFKSRTADLAAERAKAEKKAERELNAAPDSVTAMKRIWSYRKCGDGIIITSYKGERSEIYVPRTIGKDTVTAIGNGAFSPLQTRISQKSICFRMNVLTKITLPKTIKLIDPFAFNACRALREIDLPTGLTDIGYHAFYDCEALEKLTLSGGVKYIAEEAFAACPRLTVYVRRGSHAERYCRERNIRFEIREDV